MLAACLSVQLLVACDHNHTEEEEQETAYPDTGLSKYDPPIELTFVREGEDELMKALPGETVADNRWTRLYEEALGIKIKYDWVEQGDLYRQKLGVALASGNIPDVVKVNAEQLRTLTNQGMIQELTDVFDTYATPLTKKVLSEEGTGPFDSATIDGKLMAIPDTSSSIEGAMFLWIRTDWLNRLGLQPPSTMDDVLMISKAFTENDPDQNGVDDTYGLALTQYLWDPVMGIGGFMAGYGASPTMWIKDASGKLVYGGIQPEAKSALKALQEMYRSGQIDADFGFKDGEQEGKLIASGKLGMFYGVQWGSFVAQSSRKDGAIAAEWQAFPIVSVSGEKPKVPLPFSTYQYLAVKKSYEHPEALVKLMNLHLEKNWGETAEYETYYSTPQPVWKLSPVTPYPLMKNLEAFRQVEVARRTGDTSLLKDEAKAIHKNIEVYKAGGADRETGWGWERTYGPEGAFSVLEQYIEHDQLSYESFTGPPTATVIEKETVLRNLQIEAFRNIILGRPIEEFDRFAAEWRKLGGDQMTAEVNQAMVSRKP
ncbi:putative aldouronate transport system substrate-binding protein [Paenibacillus methanolicus]|uniref:Putative aldouronate transport system substrate-binding protein n=2 Tax=Paenibacillus methanolicus TaxID=582686 RepID=A0A5S5CCF7_9BACL|nr:putative aldouronate transport system substrate-binding protein [Paenibacillus methanolicus]